MEKSIIQVLRAAVKLMRPLRPDLCNIRLSVKRYKALVGLKIMPVHGDWGKEHGLIISLINKLAKLQDSLTSFSFQFRQRQKENKINAKN